ncbi:MAG: adenylate/guanylate cyclase domain-containing protein [Spirochaetes bacterium]|nr:adenylate/guanylate cyclase domain-containing protein [Spirochaetota bacterium]
MPGKFIIKLLLTASALCIAGLVFSCAPAEPFQELSGTWTVLEAPAGANTLTIPGEYRHTGGATFSLSHTFVVSEQMLAGDELWIDLMRPDFPLELYLNGSLILRRGNPPYDPNFFSTASQIIVFLPRELLRDNGQANSLLMKIYSQVGRVRFNGLPRLIGRQAALYHRSVLTFLNTNLFLMFGAVSLIGGLYFLSLWVGKRQLKERLYYALAAIFMSLYFFEFGSSIPLVNSSWYFSVCKGSLHLSIGFLVCFFLEFFKIHNKRPLRLVVMAVFAASAMYIALTPGDNLRTLDHFTQMLVPLQLAIMFSVYLLVRALARGNPDAPPVFIGIMLGVAFGTHDVVYQVMGTVPVVWLQGMGFFVLEGSMFFTLALHSNRMYRTLETFSDELVQQREELVSTNQAFARFVPDEFLTFLGKESVMEVKLGDQVQNQMTILFTDIRNFTSLSEQMTPRENFSLINSYLNHMAPVVRERGGFIDKYIGDSIMALYPDSPAQAIESAIAMRSLLIEYNNGRKRAGYPPLDMGVGIHTGMLMLGIIGEENRMESTVISDAVNTASRLENLTKVFGVSIIISQAALDADPACRNSSELRYLGAIPLKGRSQGLGVYEVLHQNDPAYAAKLANRELFHSCVTAWEKLQDHKQGNRDVFAEYLNVYPEDPALNYYLNKSGYFFMFPDGDKK